MRVVLVCNSIEHLAPLAYAQFRIGKNRTNKINNTESGLGLLDLIRHFVVVRYLVFIKVWSTASSLEWCAVPQKSG